LGATPFYAFRKVMLPLLLPGVASGAVFAFVTSFDEVIMTMFVASPQQRTLPLQIWSGVQESSSPVIISAAMILMLASSLLMLLMEVFRRRRVAMAS
jgi:putative spermidine/putrescine transport system permease protein